MESTYSRVSNACCGYLTKCNLPVSRGKPDPFLFSEPVSVQTEDRLFGDACSVPVSGQTARASSPPDAVVPVFSSTPGAPSEMPSCPGQSGRGSSPRLTSPRRCFRYSVVSPRTPGMDVVEDRLRAWAVGRDDEGSLWGICKSCYVGAGKRISAIGDVRARSWEASFIFHVGPLGKLVSEQRTLGA